ncbi:17587_t:CDS:2 [Rhizophagus irregularis]|nr:17587_t:CDS:2 [Rhizophagus irregularis]
MFGLWKSTSGDFYNLLETVLIAADELCLNEFCEHTEKFLLNNEPLLKQNFILIQKTVNKLGQFEKLTQFYETSINDEPSLILRANDFITIQQETLLEFLTEYNQRLNPMEIWDKLIEWSIGQYNELPKNTKEWTNNDMSIFGTLINPFITFIDFEKISLTNFFEISEYNEYEYYDDPDYRGYLYDF